MIIDECKAQRIELKQLADNVKLLLMQGESKDETRANIMLAYRHLEDASMRLGKAIQAEDGGISVYDKREVPA